MLSTIFLCFLSSLSPQLQGGVGGWFVIPAIRRQSRRYNTVSDTLRSMSTVPYLYGIPSSPPYLTLPCLRLQRPFDIRHSFYSFSPKLRLDQINSTQLGFLFFSFRFISLSLSFVQLLRGTIWRSPLTLQCPFRLSTNPHHWLWMARWTLTWILT